MKAQIPSFLQKLDEQMKKPEYGAFKASFANFAAALKELEKTLNR